jgi:hypothetical protein
MKSLWNAKTVGQRKDILFGLGYPGGYEVLAFAEREWNGLPLRLRDILESEYAATGPA